MTSTTTMYDIFATIIHKHMCLIIVKPTNTASSEVNRITDDEVVKQHTEVRQEFTAKCELL